VIGTYTITAIETGQGRTEEAVETIHVVYGSTPVTYGTSKSCTAAPHGTCKFTPSSGAVKLTGTGTGNAIIENLTTHQTNSFLMPSTVQVFVTPGDPTELINKSTSPVTMTLFSPSTTSGSSSQPTSGTSSGGPLLTGTASVSNGAIFVVVTPPSTGIDDWKLSAEYKTKIRTEASRSGWSCRKPAATTVECKGPTLTEPFTAKVGFTGTAPSTLSLAGSSNGGKTFGPPALLTITESPSSTPTSTPTPGSTSGTNTGSSLGCAVVHSEQSCSFTATGSTIILAGTGNGQLYIENLVTKQGSGFPAPTTGDTYRPIKGDEYVVRNYSNADMKVRQQ
jgi:hypothetical protein